jgi:hypothetical protein
MKFFCANEAKMWGLSQCLKQGGSSHENVSRADERVVRILAGDFRIPGCLHRDFDLLAQPLADFV